MRYLLIIAGLFLAVPAVAQVPPVGTPTVNQAVSARALTPNDGTVLPAITRGLHIAGDAGGAACNASVVFARDADAGAVTLSNLQPGIAYPYSIRQLRSTGTTCVATVGLY